MIKQSGKKLRSSLCLSIALSSVVLGLAGCGFSPMYCGDRSQSQPICISVKGDGYLTYKFRRELEKRLAITPRLNDHNYRLTVDLTEIKTAASYAQDATISRSQITVSARYELRQDGKTYGNFADQITTSYPVVAADEFITRNADTSAISRVAIMLAEDVARDINRLIRTGGKNPK